MSNNFKIQFCFLALAICFFSCLSTKKNNQYAKDYLNLSKKEYAEKYFSLYNGQLIDFNLIKENSAYLTYCENETFQIIVFCEDGYTYKSRLLPVDVLMNKLPKQKLFRDSYFSIQKDLVKFEKVNVNIISTIEEGTIKDDTIFMKKSYNSKNKRNLRTLTNKYILSPQFNVYKFSNDYFIVESK